MLEVFCETEEARDCTHLVRFNRANIVDAYWRAWDNDVPDPVVVVLDLRDAKAATMARSRSRKTYRIRKLIDECAEKQVIPTAILVLPHDDALEAMARISQSARKALLGTIPRGYFRAIAIGFGEHSHCASPEPKKDDY